MPEIDTIHADALPLTYDSLVEQFSACGLAAGQTILVHSSMSSMGWIVGGAVDVIRALLHVLGDDGTLMMPTHTSNNTEPSHWQNPPVPEHWWPLIRQHRPAYEPRVTPSWSMGAIPEVFRTWPGAIRSGHPIGSFTAVGKNAAYVTDDHNLEREFGQPSPIGKLYELDGCILLLGVPHENNTSLHLAEHRAQWPGKQYHREGTAMLVNGERQWVEYEMLKLDTDDFNAIGAAYEARYEIPIHKVGRADVRFLRQRPLVDFAVEYMELHRK